MKDGWGRSASVSSVVLYAGITVVVVIVLIIVMSSLGNEPQVQVSIGTRAPDDWELVTTADKSLTAHLPQGWNWFDRANVEQEDRLRELIAEDGSFLAGTFPLGGAVDDLEVVFLAVGPTSGSSILPTFMVVATSEKLNRLSYGDTSVFLDEGDFTISEMRYIDNFDRSYLSIVTEPELESAGDQLRCRQQFIKGEDEGMLLALCAPTTRFYTVQQIIFEEIFNSFQRLS
ncbi:MAG: hypothetical protein WA996_05765 [Candidatus Promineifilaceae bacterium]